MSDRENAEAWERGYMAAINDAPEHVWFPGWDDAKNPYKEASR